MGSCCVSCIAADTYPRTRFRLACGVRSPQWLDPLQFLTLCSFDLADFVGSLQSEPELFRGPEKFRQTDSSVGADPALLQNNVIDSRSRNPEGFGEPVGRKLQRLQELLAQTSPGVNFPVGSAFSFNRHYAAPTPVSLTLFHPWI